MLNEYLIMIILQVVSVVAATVFNLQVVTLRNAGRKPYAWFYKWAMLESGLKQKFGLWWIEDRTQASGKLKRILLFPLIDGFNASKFIMIGFYNLAILLPILFNISIAWAIFTFVVLTYLMRIILELYLSMRHRKWKALQV